MAQEVSEQELAAEFAKCGLVQLERYAVDWNGLFAVLDCVERPAEGVAKKYRLTFDGIYCVQLGGAPDRPEPFEISRTSTLLADYEPRCGIYCSSPLPDPLRFYTEAAQLLRSEILLPHPIEAYLNHGQNPDFQFAHWLDLSYSRAYLLITGPEVLINRCTELVEVQAVEYQVMPSRPEDAPSKRPSVAWRTGAAFLPSSFILADSVSGTIEAV